MKTMPKDVEYRRVPTIFRESWVPHARLFYALEAMGELEKAASGRIRRHAQGKPQLNDKQQFLEWAANKGADRKKLEEAYDSFAVQTKTQRAIQMTKLYGITGTPSVVVDGKYLTSPGMTLSATNRSITPAHCRAQRVDRHRAQRARREKRLAKEDNHACVGNHRCPAAGAADRHCHRAEGQIEGNYRLIPQQRWRPPTRSR